MSADKLLYSRIRHELDAELRALFPEKRFHHAREQGRQALAHIIARGGKLLDGYSIEQSGIASVQPLIIRGA